MQPACESLLKKLAAHKLSSLVKAELDKDHPEFLELYKTHCSLRSIELRFKQGFYSSSNALLKALDSMFISYLGFYRSDPS